METIGISRIGDGITRGTRKNNRKRRAGRITIVVSFAIAILLFAGIMNEILIRSTPPQERALVSYAPEVVVSGFNVGLYSSLAINSNTNYPMIVCYSPDAQNIIYSVWEGSSWIPPSTGLPHPLDFGRFCSIALNATNADFVSYYESVNGDLLISGPYSAEVIDSIGDVGQYSSIAVNPVTNTIAISYYDASNGNLKVAVNASGSGWTNTTVDSIGDVGLYTNMVFMGINDTMSVVYYDATNHALKNAWQWGGAGPWYNMTIDSLGPTGDVGKWPSQFTIGDNWWCSYYDQTNGDLKFQSFVGYSIGVAVPDSVGDVGEYTSIGVNSTGRVFISYYDNTSKDLKLAWNESSAWYNMTLDSTGDVGLYTSLKIGSDDVVQISYYDATNKDLKYVKILPTEIPIPEFSEIAIPIVGIIATIAIFYSRRKRE